MFDIAKLDYSRIDSIDHARLTLGDVRHLFGGCRSNVSIVLADNVELPAATFQC